MTNSTSRASRPSKVSRHSKGVLPFLKTLHLIPDDVILAMATDEFDLEHGSSCVCGMAIREDIFANTGYFPGDAHEDAIEGCKTRFGGTYEQWRDVYWGVSQIPEEANTNPDYPSNHLPEIEEAFVTRVLECL